MISGVDAVEDLARDPACAAVLAALQQSTDELRDLDGGAFVPWPKPAPAGTEPRLRK